LKLFYLKIDFLIRRKQRDADGELQQVDVDRSPGLPREDEALGRMRSGPRNPGRNSKNPNSSIRIHNQVFVERAAFPVSSGSGAHSASFERSEGVRSQQNCSSGEKVFLNVIHVSPKTFVKSLLIKMQKNTTSGAPRGFLQPEFGKQFKGSP
jgi:hypothetical protein